jgi:hypothetical protein
VNNFYENPTCKPENICGSPLPLSLADAGGRSEIFWQRTEDAAPTGLGNFWCGFLQRCRAYGAGKTVVATELFAELLHAENFT